MVLHAGGAKTGTSAIQNFLFSHGNALRKFGFAYANGPQPSHAFEITSGNGSRLVSILNSSEPSFEKIKEAIVGYFDGSDNAIISSEDFENLTDNAWELLRASCEELRVQTKIVFFVRNLGSLAVSAYDQTIKRHGEWQGIDDWVKGYSWSHYDTLMRISKVFVDKDIKVLSYDVERHNLIGSFLRIIELADADFSHDAIKLNATVNRSLDKGERDCLRRINKIFGDAYSRDLSDYFIYARPRILPKPDIISESSIRFLSEKYQVAVDWINSKFFSDNLVVSVLDQESGTRKKHSESLQDKAVEGQEMDIFISWLIDKMSKPQVDVVQIFCQSLKNIDWHNAGHPFIPDGFDPFAYLLNNIDLITANVRPYEHYIAFGRNEGRAYKWMK